MRHSWRPACPRRRDKAGRHLRQLAPGHWLANAAPRPRCVSVFGAPGRAPSTAPSPPRPPKGAPPARSPVPVGAGARALVEGAHLRRADHAGRGWRAIYATFPSAGCRYPQPQVSAPAARAQGLLLGTSIAPCQPMLWRPGPALGRLALALRVPLGASPGAPAPPPQRCSSPPHARGLEAPRACPHADESAAWPLRWVRLCLCAEAAQRNCAPLKPSWAPGPWLESAGALSAPQAW